MKKYRSICRLVVFMICMIFLSFPVSAKPKKYIKSLSMPKTPLEMYDTQTVTFKVAVKTNHKTVSKKITIKSSNQAIPVKIISKKTSAKKCTYTVSVIPSSKGQATITVRTKAKSKTGKRLSKKLHVNVKHKEDTSQEDPLPDPVRPIPTQEPSPKPAQEKEPQIVEPEPYSIVDSDPYYAYFLPPASSVSTNNIEIPSYKGQDDVAINNNTPFFIQKDLSLGAFEQYSNLDDLGRCGTAFADLCKELMPTEERTAIGHIKPSGWHTVKYPEVIEDLYLYNRCHLIGFQLAGENDNEKNLITGTRYLNVSLMLPYENEVAAYIRQEGCHVLYRVTPIFKDTELVCRGVLMEGYSVEDHGKSICFNRFLFNVQPGVEIDYATGDSHLKDGTNAKEDTLITYVLNTNTKKFHLPDCKWAQSISDKNKEIVTEYRQNVIDDGYEPCGTCNP